MISERIFKLGKAIQENTNYEKEYSEPKINEIYIYSLCNHIVGCPPYYHLKGYVPNSTLNKTNTVLDTEITKEEWQYLNALEEDFRHRRTEYFNNKFFESL